MSKRNRPNPSRFGIATTLDGDIVHFQCDPTEAETVTETLARCFALSLPDTHRVNVTHGGYGRFTRFDIEQHKYAGGGAGYIEVLEIKNPPEEREPFVMHESLGGHSTFSEWKTLDAAISAWEKMWPSGRRDRDSEAKKQPDFLRFVDCGHLNPWFYAVGQETLIGDFATPQNLSDDPYYRLGQEFLITEFDPISRQRKLGVLKTCLGCLISEYDTEASYGNPRQHVVSRRVFFHDGSVYKQDGENGDDFVFAWRESMGGSHFSITRHEPSCKVAGTPEL